MKKVIMLAILCLAFQANSAQQNKTNLQVIAAGTWAIDGGFNHFLFRDPTTNSWYRLWCPLTQNNSKELLSTALTAKSTGGLVNVALLDESKNWTVIRPSTFAGSDGLVVGIESN